VVSKEACMGCGVCVGHCDQEAMELRLDPEKGEPLLIHNLLETARNEGRGRGVERA